MEFPLHTNNENLAISNNQQLLSDDDVSHFQNGYLNSFDDILNYASLNRWFDPPIPTALSRPHHQNMVSSIPVQKNISLNLNVKTTQNPPNYKPFTIKIPSTYPLMDINSYSTIDSFKESQQNFKTYSTPIPKKIEGISYNFCDVQGNIMRDEVVHDHRFTIGGQETNLDQTAQPQPFDFVGPNSISITNKNISNQSEDQVVKSIPSKKANIIKWKWTKTEDRQVFLPFYHKSKKFNSFSIFSYIVGMVFYFLRIL